MLHSSGTNPARVGLPDPNSVVATKVFAPQAVAAPAAAAGGAAGSTSYRILRTREMDEYDRPLADAQIPGFGVPAPAIVGDDFQGTARRAAKLDISDAAVEDFSDITDMIDSLPAEDTMIQHQPPIATNAQSGRVQEEERNVRVRAFIYAASRENDNDFHLIVGRDPNRSPSTYMTMELSGLPSHNRCC